MFSHAASVRFATLRIRAFGSNSTYMAAISQSQDEETLQPKIAGDKKNIITTHQRDLTVIERDWSVIDHF